MWVCLVVGVCVICILIVWESAHVLPSSDSEQIRSPLPKTSCGIPARASRSLLALCFGDRLLPSVFLVGTNKAGTTNMFWSLMQTFPSFVAGGGAENHGVLADMGTEQMSQLETSFPWEWKEKLFWTRNYPRGISWYLEQYPQCPSKPCFRNDLTACQGHCVSNESKCMDDCQASCAIRRMPETPAFQQFGFDASAELLLWKESPVRLRDFYGEMIKGLRFIALLRDPIETFHAHVYMRLEQKEPGLHNFSQVTKDELWKVRRGTAVGQSFMKNARWDSQLLINSQVFSLTHAAHFKMLQEWLHFVDAPQFILIFSESYFADPAPILSKLANVLDLPMCLDKTQRIGHESSKRLTRRNNYGTHPALALEATEDIASIRKFYTPQVEYLRELLELKSGPSGFHVLGNPPWLSMYNRSAS